MFGRIERFIFIAFRIGSARSNYRSSGFCNLARALDRGETTLDQISERLDASLKHASDHKGKLRVDEFHNVLFKKFEEVCGYYGWSGCVTSFTNTSSIFCIAADNRKWIGATS